MGRNPFRRLLGRRPESPEVDEAVAELSRLAAERDTLRGPAEVLAGVIRAAFLSAPEIPSGSPDLESLRAGWSRGEVAFLTDPPDLHPGRLRRRGMAIARALANGNLAAARLHQALASREVDIASMGEAVLTGNMVGVESAADRVVVDPTLMGTVLRLVLLPTLAPRSALLDAARTEGSWPAGECPHCGSLPLLAEERGLERRRFLRCGLCAAEWVAERVRCVACGESDHRALDYRFVEGEGERSRLACCASCGSRLKVIATLRRLTPPGLLVAELASVHLDLMPDSPVVDQA